MREAAKGRQKLSPGRPKKGKELIPEVIAPPPAPQTRDIRAKAAGTNGALAHPAVFRKFAELIPEAIGRRHPPPAYDRPRFTPCQSAPRDQEAAAAP